MPGTADSWPGCPSYIHDRDYAQHDSPGEKLPTGQLSRVGGVDAAFGDRGIAGEARSLNEATVDQPVGPDCNCPVRQRPAVSLFARPGVRPPGAVWVLVLVLLAAALAGTTAVLIHSRGQVASLQRQLRHARAAASQLVSAPPSSWVSISSTSVALPGTGSMTGQVTFIAANPPARNALVTITAHLRGARPHTRYTLIGGSCSSRSRYRWAAGITDARGNADLIGPAWRLSAGGRYWLELTPPIGGLHPALAGDFTAPEAISAFKNRAPGCGR